MAVIDALTGVLGIVFVLAMAVRVYLVYRATGHFPITVKRTDSAHDFIHSALIGCVILHGLNIAVMRVEWHIGYFTGGPERVLFNAFLPIDALETEALKGFGLLVATIGLAWTAVAQHQMGRHWRFGIDEANCKGVVTGGVFAYVRHPIYLGCVLISVGLFFAAPTVLSLVAAVLSVILLAIQARLEEEFMLRTHGDAYRGYTERTWRLL